MGNNRRHPLKATTIEKMGLQSEDFDLKKAGMGIRKIVEVINDRHGTQVSYFHIDHFLKRNGEKMQYYLSDDKEARNIAKKELNETIEDMQKLRKEAWDFLERLKKDEDLSMRTPVAINTLLKVIESLGKIVGNVAESTKPTIEQKVNILNLTQNIDKSIAYFENKGYIMIKKDEFDKLKLDAEEFRKKVSEQYATS